MATLGDFMKPKNHSEVVDPNAVQPAPLLSVPATIPFEPAPALSVPMAVQIGANPLPPAPSGPSVLPFEPAPPLSTPAVMPFEPAPALSTPAVIPFEPAPPLSVPATIPFTPAPLLSVPAVIQFEPAPTLSTPAVIPFEQPPVLSSPTPTRDGPISTPGPSLYQDSVSVTVSNPAVVDDVKYEDEVKGFAPDSHPAPKGVSKPGDALCITEANKNFGKDGQDTPTQIHASTINYDGGVDTTVPTLGGIRFQSLDIDTLERNAKLEAISLAQQALARTGLMTYAEKAKSLYTIATKQQTTLIDFAVGKAANALFPPGPPEAYHPVDDKVNAQQPVDPNIEDANRYKDVNFSGFPEDRDTTHTTPGSMDLRVLNNPAIKTDLKISSLAQRWDDPIRTASKLQYKPNLSVPVTSLNNDALVSSFKNTNAHFKSSEGTLETRGYFAVTGSNNDSYAKGTPTDDQAYVPLVFTDLRPLRGGVYRTVYFRPFINSLYEDFSPQWNMQNYFGRVDPVATYQSTNRTISLSFKLVSFSPGDLETIYQKLGWLTSMVYPQFEPGASLRYFAGPVVKLRIGDVINSVGRDGNRGLPGVISNLSFGYDESPWELLDGRRVPKNVDVSLGFHVLHEYAIGSIRGAGRDEGNLIFGGIDNTNNGLSGEPNARGDVGRFRATFKSDYLNDPKISVNPKDGE
jgi:hypothetical protein